VSNFFHYFSHNFEDLGLKKLITTCYKNQNRDLFSEHTSESAIYLEYTGDRNNNKVIVGCYPTLLNVSLSGTVNRVPERHKCNSVG
jgi:hypothetical protein